MREQLIAALEQRACRHDGEVRRILDARLATLRQAWGRTAGEACGGANDGAAAAGPCAPSRGPLGALVEQLTSAAAARGEAPATVEMAAAVSVFSAPLALDAVQKIWSGVRSESQLRQSLAQVPANAGPLNSGALVHRSLALMHALSPGYLRQFLAYVDDLSWLEQLGGGSLAAQDTPRPAGPRKRARAKPRG